MISIHCDNCGLEGPITARYCGTCGWRVTGRGEVAACLGCGTDNPVDAKRCRACGGRQTTTHTRRLFRTRFSRTGADYTTVFDRVGPGDTRRMFQRLEEWVHRSGPSRAGSPLTSASVAAAAARPLENGVARTAYKCAWASLLTICLGPVGFALALTAVICGTIGVSRANQGAPHRDKAVVGIVIGSVVVALLITAMIAAMVLEPPR